MDDQQTKEIFIDPTLLLASGPKKPKKPKTLKLKSTAKADAKLKKERVKEFRKSFMQKLELQQPSHTHSEITPTSETVQPTVLLNTPNDFTESLEFMKNYKAKQTKLKQGLTPQSPIISIPEVPPVPTHLQSLIHPTATPIQELDSKIPKSPPILAPTQQVTHLAPPAVSNILVLPDTPWGNLKGGTKPTFREWKTKTQKIHTTPDIIPADPSINISQDISKSSPTKSIPVKKRITKTKTSKKYKIGRSLKNRKISILLKNKTIKNKVIVANNRLKHVSLVDIKLYLKKHNLIKSGAGTPHNILRRMYESAVLAGEIFNKNDDTLLYNFNNPNIE